MSISKTKFGEYKGKEVYLYTLENSKGLAVKILNLGGIVRNILFNGKDVVLGYETPEDYIAGDTYFGALIGRNSNRIDNGEFCLNGKKYTLYKNSNGKFNLHGGKEGFDKKVWNAKAKDGKEPSLILTYTSPDGEEGFPGKLKATVTYTVTEDNALKIHYDGVSNKDTVFNMTNHAYFNLNGHDSGAVDGHRIWIDSDFYNPSTADCMPTGEILSTKDTPFDFTKDETLGEKFVSDYPQVKLLDGFDNNFALNGEGLRLVASATGDKTNIKMEVYTDKKAMQLYTGNQIKSGTRGKDGILYDRHGGFCFETQEFPGNLNFNHFPCSILKKGEKAESTTIYKFI